MGIGPNIKKYRVELSLTQSELAEKLNVTYQAVSRWENDDVEPSIDTLKEMSKIFNCTLDELLGSKEEKKEEKIEESQQPIQVVEKIIVQESKPVLGVCEHCNKPIYDGDDINRVTVHSRISRHSSSRVKILCNECNNKRLEEERKERELAESEEKKEFRKYRILGYIFGIIAAALFIAVGISSFVEKDSTTGITCMVVAVFAFTFTSCMIMHNNCIYDMFIGISSWSVRFPGILFSLDINGIIFLICTKILFAILGLLISIAAFIFAVLLSAFCSIFIYPFALYHSYKCIDNADN